MASNPDKSSGQAGGSRGTKRDRSKSPDESVKKAKRNPYNDTCVVFVDNLPRRDTTREGLKSVLRCLIEDVNNIGEVRRAHALRKDGAFAYCFLIEFFSSNEARKCADKMDGTKIGDRRIEVTLIENVGNFIRKKEAEGFIFPENDTEKANEPSWKEYLNASDRSFSITPLDVSTGSQQLFLAVSKKLEEMFGLKISNHEDRATLINGLDDEFSQVAKKHYKRSIKRLYESARMLHFVHYQPEKYTHDEVTRSINRTHQLLDVLCMISEEENVDVKLSKITSEFQTAVQTDRKTWGGFEKDEALLNKLRAEK